VQEDDQRLDPVARPAGAAPPRYRELVEPVPAAVGESNGMGVASLVFAILGLVALPVIGSVVGLVLGVVAMRREPKALAIAGTVLSVLGLLLSCALLLFAVWVFGFFANMMQGFGAQSSVVLTVGSQQRAAVGVGQHFAATGEWPADLESVNGGAIVEDGWGTPMVLKVVVEGEGPDAPTRASIESAGPDGVFGTEDDFSWPVVPLAPAAQGEPDAAP